jgi:HPt (histidine-containing phosphotransfer) domain-containing protein
MNAKPDPGPSLPPEAWFLGDSAAPPALDRRVLSGLRRLDPQQDRQLISRVLVTYRESMRRLLQQASHGHAASDWAALQLAVHTLKSASASVGAKPLAALCAAVEIAVPLRDSAQLGPMLAQMAAEVDRVDLAVSQLLLKLATPE